MTEDTHAPSAGDCNSPRGSQDAAFAPKDLTVQIEKQRLLVEWTDGSRSEFSLDDLRRKCPCASCRTEREGAAANPLRILTFDPSSVRVTSANLVGNYGIKFVWSDGHDTGIFDFGFLRELADQS